MLTDDLGEAVKAAEPGGNVSTKIDQEAVMHAGVFTAVDLDSRLLVGILRCVGQEAVFPKCPQQLVQLLRPFTVVYGNQHPQSTAERLFCEATGEEVDFSRVFGGEDVEVYASHSGH